MDRTFHKSRSFKEAECWDIEQHSTMPLQERLDAAKVLKNRVYGHNNPDIRESREWRKSKR